MESKESSDYDEEILLDMLSGNQPSPASRRSSSKLHRKGAAWDLDFWRRERETESPTPIIQIDGDDDSDSNCSDSFPEANTPPQVLNLINLFNSFEDDFDDSDI